MTSISTLLRVTALGVLALAGLAMTGKALAEQGRVLHIDSYHAGNQWNDRIAAALIATLEAAGVEVKVVHLDTKRRSTEPEKVAAAEAAVATIESFKPDLVTMSDDNAVKYVLEPHFRDAELPFVFCGLNWDASIYGLPYSNTTGMVEVSPIPQIVRLLQAETDGRRIGYLAENTPTKKKELTYHEKLFGITYDKVYLVDNFADWVQAFRQAQGEVDMLMFLGVGALTDWDEKQALAVADEETRIPAGTDFAWLAPYTLLAVAKLPEEQGRWAAEAALKILDGVEPSRIPLTYNTEGELIFNKRIAARLGMVGTPTMATIID